MKKGNGKTGRPISFDKEAALEAAMLLFGERGYEGTSMADLTEAMSLDPPSIYAAFGDKHALFQLAAKSYMEKRAIYAGTALEEPTLEKLIRALFSSTVAFLAAPGHHDAGGGGGLQTVRYTGLRSHDGNSDTESSRFKAGPS